MTRPLLPGETEAQFKIRMTELGRKGSRKGKKNKKTIDRERMLKEMQDHVASKSRTLMTSQMILAMGTIKVFRIDTETVGSGKEKKPVLVTSDYEIINALDYYYAEGESPNDDDTYYFVSTKDPDNHAIKDLLDRTFGKAQESVAVQHSGSVGLADLLGKGILDVAKDKK